MTSVGRAKAALEKTNIPHKVVELDASVTKKGCAFGIEVSANLQETAEKVMRRSGVRLKEVVKL